MSSRFPFMPLWAWLIILIAVLVVGILVLVRRLNSLIEEGNFASQYRERFIAYANSRGQDREAYTYLTLQSSKMQEAMGVFGIMRHFKPPFANFVYPQWAIVLNALPEMRQQYSEGGMFGSDRVADQYAELLDEAMLRYIGWQREKEITAQRDLRNPVSWVRAGMEFLVGFPVLFLSAFGLVSAGLAERLRSGVLFRAVSSLIAFLSLVALMMAFIVDGADAWEKVQRWTAAYFEQR